MERIDIEVWLHKIMNPKLWLHNKDILYQSGTSKEAEIGSIWPLASRVSELDLLHPISLPCGSSKLTLCIWECYRLTPWSLSWREKEMVVDDCDTPPPPPSLTPSRAHCPIHASQGGLRPPSAYLHPFINLPNHSQQNIIPILLRNVIMKDNNPTLEYSRINLC